MYVLLVCWWFESRKRPECINSQKIVCQQNLVSLHCKLIFHLRITIILFEVCKVASFFYFLFEYKIALRLYTICKRMLFIFPNLLQVLLKTNMGNPKEGSVISGGRAWMKYCIIELQLSDLRHPKRWLLNRLKKDRNMYYILKSI